MFVIADVVVPQNVLEAVESILRGVGHIVGSVGAVVFTALHGTAWGVRGTLLSTIRADYFGRRSGATISG